MARQVEAKLKRSVPIEQLPLLKSQGKRKRSIVACMIASFILLPCLAFGQIDLEQQSMLYQADQIAKKYRVEMAKAAPPSPLPQIDPSLNTASVWFAIDLNEMAPKENQTLFQTLNSPELWGYIREMGVEAVHLKGLKQGGAARTGIGLDPRWGTKSDWEKLAITIGRKGIALVGDVVGNSMGMGPDFCLALSNYRDYPGLYHLVEIEPTDWKLLPSIVQGGQKEGSANIPWLKLQELHKKGYVPAEFHSLTKKSAWNATAEIKGIDGTSRRWIYLQDQKEAPVLDWLRSSFAPLRIAAGDALDSIFELGQQFLQIDANISPYAKEILSLWIRKAGAFSAEEIRGGISDYKAIKADLAFDSLTRAALLHALIAEDAEALRLIYCLLLNEKIETRRLIHVLQPFDEFSSDWSELLSGSKKQYKYYDEVLTGDVLRKRLLKEDLAKLGYNDKISLSTWAGYCTSALGSKEVMNAHLLLAFFYAMQPGLFSFSVSDLLGSLPGQTNFDLMGSNKTLYASIPIQLQTTTSFAMQMKKLFTVRRENRVAKGELIEVLKSTNRGVILLLSRTTEGIEQVLAVNFGRSAAQETLDRREFRQRSAIDLLTNLTEAKPLDSSTLQLNLPPLSGKIVSFQPKYTH